MTLIPVPRRPTIPRLRDIILLVYCPSCRKGCKKWWPGISGVIYWVYPPYLYLLTNQGGPKTLQYTM